MNEPRFLSLQEVLAIHELQLSHFGGATGVRDLGLLDSAINRAINRWHYESPSLYRLAADYAFGIACNHPFVDGNKRAAFMSAYTYLALNGSPFAAPEAEVVVTILALAAGEIGENELTEWFECSCTS